MGTYSKIEFKKANGNIAEFEVKGDADWLGEILAYASFWTVKDGKVQARSDGDVLDFLQDELYAWESSPDSFSYLVTLDGTDYLKTTIQEYGYCSHEKIGGPSHLHDYWNKYIRAQLSDEIKAIIEHTPVTLDTKVRGSDTLGSWLAYNSRFAYVNKIKVFDNNNLITEDIEGYKDRVIENIFNLQDGYLYIYLK